MATAAMGAPAPQHLVQVHNAGLHTVAHAPPTFIRTIPAATSHAHSTTVHTAPTVVRTVTPQLHLVNHPQPATVVRTVAAAPAIQHVVAQAPVQQTVVRTVPAYETVEEEVEIAASPNYSFGYSVADVRSGDAKTREETRDGDSVTGSYTVADPDGRLRRVTYTADKEHGFQATVTYDGEEGPPAIPIDAPQQTVVAAAADDVVVAERTQDAEDNSATLVHAVAAPAATVVRTVQPASTLIHAAPTAHQVVRTSAVGDVHALHNVHTAPVHHAVVRTAAAPITTTQLLHGAAPNQIVRVAGTPQGQFVTASSPFGFARAFPSTISAAGTHLVHA